MRLKKPKQGAPPKPLGGLSTKKLRKIKPASSVSKNISIPNLSPGTLVEHIRFGKGKIMKIEGTGADTKAEILFENGGLKKLLLRFAKLEVLS